MNRLTLPIAVLAVGASSLLTQTLNAGGLEEKQIPADAKWVVHFDLDAMGDGALVEVMKEKKSDLMEKIKAKASERYGIDVDEDLRSATFYGTSFEPHTGVMVLNSEYDKAKLESRFAEKGASQSKFHDYTLYTMKGKNPGRQEQVALKPVEGQDIAKQQDEAAHRNAKSAQQRAIEMDHEKVFVLKDETHLIAASSEELAKSAIALLDGEERDTLRPRSDLLAGYKKGATVYGSAVELNTIQRPGGLFEILKQHKQISYVAGQENGEFFEHTVLEADSPAVSRKMEEVVEGMVAAGKLWAGESRELKKVMRDVKVDRKGKTLEVHFNSDADQVVNALEVVWERREELMNFGHKQ
ncbi:hypothetical protein [Lacunimicrobium album]